MKLCCDTRIVSENPHHKALTTSCNSVRLYLSLLLVYCQQRTKNQADCVRAATHIYALVLPNTVNLLKYFKNGFSCYFISQLRSVFGASAKFRHTLFTFLFKKQMFLGQGLVCVRRLLVIPALVLISLKKLGKS